MFFLCRHLKRIRKTQRKAKDLHSPTNYPGSTQTDPGSKCPNVWAWALSKGQSSSLAWLWANLDPKSSEANDPSAPCCYQPAQQSEGIWWRSSPWKSQTQGRQRLKVPKKLKNIKFLQDVFQLRMLPDEGGVSSTTWANGKPTGKNSLPKDARWDGSLKIGVFGDGFPSPRGLILGVLKVQQYASPKVRRPCHTHHTSNVQILFIDLRVEKSIKMS